MKSILVVLGVLLAGAVVSGKPQDKYTTKYDGVNVEEVLQSGRLLNNYVKCFLDKGPCTPDGQEMKNMMPDALLTECSKCSQTQKDKGKIVLHFILQNHPEIWKQMEAKYDPEGVYRKRYDKYKAELSAAERAAIGL